MDAVDRIFQNAQLDGNSFFWKNGPTGVLLLHGFTATTTEVRPLATYLRDAGYSVAAPLLPGHGTSPDDLNRQKWRDWVTAAEAAYQDIRNKCDVIFVGGLSMGGLLTLYLASQHPEIAGILLYAPAFDIPKLRAARWVSLFRRSVSKRKGERVMPWKGYRVNPLAAAAELYQLSKLVSTELEHIQQPTIIFQGLLDQTVNPRGAQQVYDRIQSANKKLHWLEDSTHVLLLDREFDQVASLSLDFLKYVSSDSVIMKSS